MDTRPLGSTALIVSRIGFGLAALGRPEYLNLGRDTDLGGDRSVTAMEQRCHRMLDLTHAAGIRYVDAARSYGLAEQFLASWLTNRPVAAESTTVGSKWGYTYTADWQLGARVHEVKDLSMETLQRQIGESRGLLGAHLRLYQIHSATIESGVLEDARVLNALARLRAEGLVIGLSVSGPRQAEVIRRALQVSVDGVNPFQVVQATWNLLEISAGPALAEAKDRHWGVIVKEALANGRLTDREAHRAGARIHHEATARGATVDALAIAAALGQPWADVVLSGAVTPSQLHSNLAALNVGVDGLASLSSLAIAPQEYWAQRGVLAWE
jgi:aryl-alcohol dehydrogenase-like predicted oxidoreductase